MQVSSGLEVRLCTTLRGSPLRGLPDESATARSRNCEWFDLTGATCGCQLSLWRVFAHGSKHYGTHHCLPSSPLQKTGNLSR